MPNQALQILCAGSHSTQSNPILQLTEERLDLSSLSLAAEEVGLLGSL
jgi:hypothetical protein